MSTRSDEGLLPLIDDRSDHDDIAVTLEPSMNREHHHDHLDNSLSSISDAPSVDHFNISVRFLSLTKILIISLYALLKSSSKHSIVLIVEN